MAPGAAASADVDARLYPLVSPTPESSAASIERRLLWLFSALQLDHRLLQDICTADTHPAVPPRKVSLFLVETVCTASFGI